MKKTLKRIFALICVVTMFSAPSTALAASEPVLVYQDDTSKFFEFQPDPYFVSAGNGTILQDTTNAQRWSVPAGHGFLTQFDLTGPGAFNVRIYKLEPIMELVYDETRGPYFSFFNHYIPPISTNTDYLVVVFAVTNIYITGYAGTIY